MARASVAAQRRRARSSSTDSRLVYFVLMVWTVTFRMQTILPIEGENWISYSGETHKPLLGTTRVIAPISDKPLHGVCLVFAQDEAATGGIALKCRARIPLGEIVNGLSVFGVLLPDDLF